ALAARLRPALTLRTGLARLGGAGRRPLRARAAGDCRLLLGAPLPALLPRLPVHGVAAAPAAVLLELDAVRRVPLRLLRLVVAPLALGAGERDCDSDSGCHSCSFPRGGRAQIAPGGLEPPTSAL